MCHLVTLVEGKSQQCCRKEEKAFKWFNFEGLSINNGARDRPLFLSYILLQLLHSLKNFLFHCTVVYILEKFGELQLINSLNIGFTGFALQQWLTTHFFPKYILLHFIKDFLFHCTIVYIRGIRWVTVHKSNLYCSIGFYWVYTTPMSYYLFFLLQKIFK